MAKRRIYKTRIMQIPILIGAGLLIFAQSGHTQEKGSCVTVKECAQQMVDLANSLKADNEALSKRLVELEETQYEFECKTKEEKKEENNTGNKSYELTARVPVEDMRNGYVVTGGGCVAIDGDARYVKAISASHMAKDSSGWFCKTDFTHAHAITNGMIAHVNYCRLVKK